MVKVPKPESDKDNCTVTPGGRYLIMLGGKSLPDCDGLYYPHSDKMVDSFRPPLHVSACVPYPNWPAPDTAKDGKGRPLRMMFMGTIP